jgi:hypothetical protein
MTKKQFKQNLIQALEYNDTDLSNEEIDKIIEDNFDESEELANWTFANFNTFALDVATEGLRRACKFSDLYYESDKEDDED